MQMCLATIYCIRWWWWWSSSYLRQFFFLVTKEKSCFFFFTTIMSCRLCVCVYDEMKWNVSLHIYKDLIDKWLDTFFHWFHIDDNQPQISGIFIILICIHLFIYLDIDTDADDFFFFFAFLVWLLSYCLVNRIDDWIYRMMMMIIM